MILLCDKVPKEDIQIRFFEPRGDSAWEAYADFQPAQVHHQVKSVKYKIISQQYTTYSVSKLVDKVLFSLENKY